VTSDSEKVKLFFLTAQPRSRILFVLPLHSEDLTGPSLETI